MSSASAHSFDCRCLVGHSEWRGAHQRLSGRQQPRNGIYSRDRLRFFDGEQRQQYTEPLECKRLAATGRTVREHVVFSCGGNLQPANQKRLTVHFTKFKSRFNRTKWNSSDGNGALGKKLVVLNYSW